MSLGSFSLAADMLPMEEMEEQKSHTFPPKSTKTKRTTCSRQQKQHISTGVQYRAHVEPEQTEESHMC